MDNGLYSRNSLQELFMCPCTHSLLVETFIFLSSGIDNLVSSVLPGSIIGAPLKLLSKLIRPNLLLSEDGCDVWPKHVGALYDRYKTICN
jgi:hypothetical protein